MDARPLNLLAGTFDLAPNAWVSELMLEVDDRSRKQSPNPDSPVRSLGKVGPLVALLLPVRGATAVAEAGA